MHGRHQGLVGQRTSVGVREQERSQFGGADHGTGDGVYRPGGDTPRPVLLYLGSVGSPAQGGVGQTAGELVGDALADMLRRVRRGGPARHGEHREQNKERETRGGAHEQSLQQNTRGKNRTMLSTSSTGIYCGIGAPGLVCLLLRMENSRGTKRR